MLPESQDDPASLLQPPVSINVTGSIGSHFFRPIGRVRGGNGVMFWTPVPEASIEEDGDPLSRKYDVGGPPPAR